MKHAILLISCPDSKGINAEVSQFIHSNNGNICYLDQHLDQETNTFFMRLAFELDGFKLDNSQISSSFNEIADRFDMNWELHFSANKPRVAIYVSKHLHCLYDLLLRHKEGQLPCEIPLIISNHLDAEGIAQNFGITYRHLPITPKNKLDQEKAALSFLSEANIDFIVLARYHQILTQDFISHYPNKIINIHHSFLPAFVGQKPYHQAFEKGVKIIGATSHYVTEKLDEGPIIEQDIVRISHRDSVDDLIDKGRDLERIVLSRALLKQLERKILCYGNKTVIFD